MKPIPFTPRRRYRKNRYRRSKLLDGIGRYTPVLVLLVIAVGLVLWDVTPIMRSLNAFPNCAAARAAGKAPLYRGDPGYARYLDADNDGIACEPWRRHSQ